MQPTLHIQKQSITLDENAGTLLAAIQNAGVEFSAPCGGGGTCKKCRVLVRDASETRYVLACQTNAADVTEVYVDNAKPMVVADDGIDLPFSCEEGQSGYGFAIDVGTTTLACHLYDLSTGTKLSTAGRSNPQASFGADVLARINASIDGKLDAMAMLLGTALESMMSACCKDEGVSPESIERVTLAGNTVMEHIACGLDPSPIGVAPFTPRSFFGDERRIPGFSKPALFTPVISGYVGGDITADILVTQMAKGEKLTLMIDLGTNGEMALGSSARVLTCATAAGPVFEGANIACGMPARPGAIAACSFKDGELHLTTIQDEAPCGICGTGLISAIAMCLDEGIVDETGYMLDADEAEGPLAALLQETDDGMRLNLADGVYLTQSDVRNVQLAKAAICAGARTLFEEYGICAEDVDALLIAGGFGQFLDIEAAARIALIPPELASRAHAIGNGAVQGAASMLISAQARKEAASIATTCDYIELSCSQRFNALYIEEMSFPE